MLVLQRVLAQLVSWGVVLPGLLQQRGKVVQHDTQTQRTSILLDVLPAFEVMQWHAWAQGICPRSLRIT